MRIKPLLIGILLAPLLLSSYGGSLLDEQDLNVTDGSKFTNQVSTGNLQRNFLDENSQRFQAERANLAFNWRRTDYLKTEHRRTSKRQLRVAPKQFQVGTPTNDVWYSLFGCETGYTYNAHINTGNGYYGAFQFSLGTWQSVGGSGYPHEHSYETQRAFAIKLQQRSGWGQWPKCSKQLGLR